MKIEKYIFFLIIIVVLSGGCSAVGISPGIGLGWGSGGRIGAGISLNTWMKPDGDWGSDSKYRDFYIKNYKYLVKRYDKLSSQDTASPEEVKELKVKMIALRQQVNTQWNEIDKRRDFIRNFNQDIDFYISSIERYEITKVWQ